MRFAPTLTALGLALAPAAPARAGWLGELWESVHLDADVGVYAARLSGGLSSLNAAWGEGSAVNDAVSSIGTGEGTLWSLSGSLTVLGHDLLFNYTSDKLLDDGTQRALGGELGGGYVEDALLWLAGELRPDLGDLMGEYSKPWVRIEYGDFEGSIENAWRFGTRNGRPWFGGRDAGWSSRLINVEAGAYLAYGEAPRDKTEYARWKRRHRDEPERGGVGFYLRYTSFDRPVVLGYDADDRNGFALQDADVGMLAAGMRWDLKGCDGPWCLAAVGSFIPFTGWTWMDLGKFGSQRGLALSGGFDLRGSVKWRVAGSFQVEPYVSFRADWMFPITGNFFDTDIDNYTLWAPDFLLWGPGAGLQVRL